MTTNILQNHRYLRDSFQELYGNRPSVYETCQDLLRNGNYTTNSTDEYAADGDYDINLIECITKRLQAGQVQNIQNTNTWFLILSTALIFFMQAGFAMLCAGAVRKKNVANTMLKNLMDACGAAIGFFTIGFAFAFGGQEDTDATTFVGTANFALSGLEDDKDYAFWIFQFAFAATSTTIVAGTLAERCQMTAYLCYSIVLTGFIFPVIAHAIWSRNGFLSARNIDPFLDVGVIDFAGSSVVHVTGGATALFATLILGPRTGRFYDQRGNPLTKPKPFPGHSMALQMLGTFILWFCWYGFNAGSALLLSPDSDTSNIAALAAVNTTLSAGTAGVVALFTALIIEERLTGEAKFDLKMLMNGSLSGLVSITAGCAIVEPWASILIGGIAGWLYMITSAYLISQRIDDAVDAIPVHLACGMWGTFAVGLLASPQRLMAAYGTDDHVGWFYSFARGNADANLMGTQVCCILFVIGLVLFVMLPFFIWLNYMGWLRADTLEELVGLDISYHGGDVLANDEVKLEYVEAFNRRKESKRLLAESSRHNRLGVIDILGGSRHRKEQSLNSSSTHNNNNNNKDNPQYLLREPSPITIPTTSNPNVLREPSPITVPASAKDEEELAMMIPPTSDVAKLVESNSANIDEVYPR